MAYITSASSKFYPYLRSFISFLICVLCCSGPFWGWGAPQISGHRSRGNVSQEVSDSPRATTTIWGKQKEEGTFNQVSRPIIHLPNTPRLDDVFTWNLCVIPLVLCKLCLQFSKLVSNRLRSKKSILRCIYTYLWILTHIYIYYLMP